MSEQQADYVLRTVEERRIRYVQLWFTDVLGRQKAFHVTPAELEDALDEGMTFDGSAIDGFSRVQEADVLAKPDLDTFQLCPWHPERRGRRTRRLRHHDRGRTPFEGCPRHRLRRVLDEAHEAGFTMFVAPEVEYFYFDSLTPASPPQPVDRGSYFDLGTDDRIGALRRNTVRTLEEMGIPVEHAQHEDGPGQHELDLRYTDALTMADTVMTVRHVVKELARAEGVAASFMPKPLEGVQGSGMHTHVSLWRGGENAFIDAADALRPVAARLPLHRGPAHPREGDHRGDQPVGELLQAPRRRARGARARQLGAQQPLRPRADPHRQAVEVGLHPDRVPVPRLSRQPVPVLRRHPRRGAGGVRGGYELPEEATGNLFDRAEGRGFDAPALEPQGGHRHDGRVDLLHETLGEHVVEWFLRNKRAEWSAYAETVTPFELDRYLPLL